MRELRKRYSGEFKGKVALEAVKGMKTVTELSSEYGVHPKQIVEWKKQLHEGIKEIFSSRRRKNTENEDELKARLYEEIGRLKIELDWLKKRLPQCVDIRRTLIEPANSEISIRKQCKLIGLSRASFYYHSAQESEENLKLMRLIDEKYIIRPFYGSRKMTLWLQEQGYCVNRKRVQRLMQLIGIEAIYPKPRTTVAHPEHKIYPYLLRGLVIERPDQVWCTDITYIPMRYGFMYLMAIMDGYSRYVITWQLSNTLDSDFCVDALEEALSGKKPEIFNSDQGSQFTSLSFTDCLKKAEVKISMDGRGRVADKDCTSHYTS